LANFYLCKNIRTDHQRNHLYFMMTPSRRVNKRGIHHCDRPTSIARFLLWRSLWRCYY